MGVSLINLREFGLLVKTLRKNSVDDNGNMWTRESLSEAVHLTPNQLGRLERGDRKYLDTQTLQLLAEALNLTTLEQKEFFSAAVSPINKTLLNPKKPDEQLSNLYTLIEMLRIPAFAIDPYGDIIASNTSAANLFCITPEVVEYARTIPLGLNYMYLLYSSTYGFKDIFGPKWKEIAALEILLFRRATLRYRHTEYFKYIFENLLSEKQFDIDWYASHRNQKTYDLTHEIFEYDHPRYGQLKYIATETITDTQKGNIYLLMYNPADQATLSVFNSLHGPNKNHLHKLARWPEKIMI